MPSRSLEGSPSRAVGEETLDPLGFTEEQGAAVLIDRTGNTMARTRCDPGCHRWSTGGPVSSPSLASLGVRLEGTSPVRQTGDRDLTRAVQRTVGVASASDAGVGVIA